MDELRAFTRLYPDVDPATPLPLTRGERLSITVATAVLAYGGSRGDLLVTGAGLALLLFALGVATFSTPRRVRHEARVRFPGVGWVEGSSTKTLLTWAVIAVLVLATLLVVPGLAPGTALVSAALLWFALAKCAPIWSDHS